MNIDLTWKKTADALPAIGSTVLALTIAKTLEYCEVAGFDRVVWFRIIKPNDPTWKYNDKRSIKPNMVKSWRYINMEMI